MQTGGEAPAQVAAVALDVGVGANVGGGVGANVGGSGSDNSGGSGGINLGGNANAGAGAQAQTDSGTTGSIGSDANLDLVISAIGSGDDNAATIQGMTDVSSVTVVDAGDLAHPGACIDVHHDVHRVALEGLVGQQHQIEAAQVRAQQQAALARCQCPVHQRVALDRDVKAVEFAGRHIDAVEQGGGE